MTWETIDTDETATATKRLAVPGGYLYRVSRLYGQRVAEALCFVPTAAATEPPKPPQPPHTAKAPRGAA